MTKYYCIVFIDKIQPENPHPKHGTICSNSRELCIYTDKAEAERMYNDSWCLRTGYWTGCYELWEFDVP